MPVLLNTRLDPFLSIPMPDCDKILIFASDPKNFGLGEAHILNIHNCQNLS